MFKKKVKEEFGIRSFTSESMNNAINNWISIYKGSPEWVDDEEGIKTIKFAKTICGEIARLATLAIDVKFDGSRSEYMQKFFENSVSNRLREWVEYGCAYGTVILKPNGEGIDFVYPGMFEITELDSNRNITGIVFQDGYKNGDLYYTKLEYHHIMKAKVRMPGEEGYTDKSYYSISNRTYVSDKSSEIGKPIDIKNTKWSNLKDEVTITKKNGNVINSMLFGMFRMPSSNDIDLNSPLGLSAFSDAIEELKDLDVSYSRYAEEVYDSRKMVLIDERLTQLPAVKDKNGNVVRQKVKLPKYVKNVMGEGQEEFYQEINPQLNISVRKEGINNQLSIIGFKCGFSNGYFVLDEKTGMITATQVEADDRRTIQLIKDVRDAIKRCLNDLFYAQSVFADLYNILPVGTYETTYDFGDITYNYEEDKSRWWGYVQAGKVPFWKYLMKFEGMSEKEAKEIMEEAGSERKLFEYE